MFELQCYAAECQVSDEDGQIAQFAALNNCQSSQVLGGLAECTAVGLAGSGEGGNISG